MSKATTKEVRALLDTASEMFDETGCVPGIDGEEVRAETMVPDAKEYISESIDNPEVLCDSETWDRPGFTLVLSWLAQKWLQKCHKLAPRGSKNPEQHLTKEQQKACLNSAAAELIREITQRQSLNWLEKRSWRDHDLQGDSATQAVSYSVAPFLLRHALYGRRKRARR